MPNFTAGTSFTDGVTNDVTAAKLNALIADAVPTSSLSLNSTTGTISQFSSGTGTAASPAIQPTGDTNTGIFFPAADTIAFSEGGTESMRIDSSGNVGIGTVSPSQLLTVGSPETPVISGAKVGVYNGGASLITIRDTTNDIETLIGTVTGTLNSVVGSATNHHLEFRTNNTERLRIDSSGNLLVGKTAASTSTVGFQFDLANQKIASGANGGASAFFNRNGDNGAVVQIARDGSQIGTISATTTAVAYNTSSDYRLKTNLEPISSGINRIKQLPVYRFNWIADESGNKVDGFVAHEAQAIVPECVTGEKDAVDADGNPVYQGIDQSKIVPLLTAALKEAIAKIETLESKVTALEAA